MTPRLIRVFEFAKEKHKNQKDKAGEDYIFHPIAVALMCSTESEKIVALLHDVLEDTDTTEEELKDLPITAGEFLAVECLTKQKQEDYFDYIKRVSGNWIATKVKMADLQHNMNLTRLSNINTKDMVRKHKYEKAYSMLDRAINIDVTGD